jgi:hypothetical protein
VLVIIEMKFNALIDPFLGFTMTKISELKVALIVFHRHGSPLHYHQPDRWYIRPATRPKKERFCNIGLRQQFENAALNGRRFLCRPIAAHPTSFRANPSGGLRGKLVHTCISSTVSGVIHRAVRAPPSLGGSWTL